MKHRVSGWYSRKDGKEIEFDRTFKSEQKALDYFTKIRDDIEWVNLAMTWEDENEILAEEIGNDGILR